MRTRKSADKSVPSAGFGIGAALFPKIRQKALELFLPDPENRHYFGEAVRMLASLGEEYPELMQE